MNIYNCKYINELEKININKKIMENKTIAISGASGLIGSYLIDYLLIDLKLNVKIYALVRNVEKAYTRFSKWKNDSRLKIIKCDVNEKIDFDCDNLDYVFHFASNTHPLAYSTRPISTITTNVIGTYNLLNFSNEHNCKRFVFASSVEVYGKALNNNDIFDEEYCGYINSNTLRAGYCESKRVGESLCQAFIKEKNMDVIIPRLPRVFGPTMLLDDSKASSQFIKNGINKEDIILKSKGNQFFSYCYVEDVVSAILFLLENANNGEAYNIANESCNVTLQKFAETIADYVGKKVIFDLPNEVEKQGFSTAVNAILDSKKINNLGWKGKISFDEGIKRTIDILKES